MKLISWDQDRTVVCQSIKIIAWVFLWVRWYTFMNVSRGGGFDDLRYPDVGDLLYIIWISLSLIGSDLFQNHQYNGDKRGSCMRRHWLKSNILGESSFSREKRLPAPRIALFVRYGVLFTWSHPFWTFTQPIDVFDVLWCSLIFYDVLWCSKMFYDVLWCSMMF